MKILRWSVLAVVLRTIASSLARAQNQTETEMKVQIVPGAVSIFATGRLEIGGVGTGSIGSGGEDSDLGIGAAIASGVDQEFVAAFSGDLGQYFILTDLLGSDSGYVVTISSSALTGQRRSGVIPAQNVAMKIQNGEITVLEGTGNANLRLGNLVDGVASGQDDGEFNSLAEPITLIEKFPGANFGRVGKYGLVPVLRILVPAFQTPDLYLGVLTFTLTEL